MTTPTPLPPKDGLMPCPFCGGDADPVAHTLDGKTHHWGVACDDCPCELAWEKTKAQAIAAWNQRSPTWMPIESAPKDGTKFLAWPMGGSEQRNNRGVGTAYWYIPGPHAKYGPMLICEYSTKTRKPTHWLPLPLPPKENSDGNS